MPSQEIHVPPGRAGPLQGVHEKRFILMPQNRLYQQQNIMPEEWQIMYLRSYRLSLLLSELRHSIEHRGVKV